MFVRFGRSSFTLCKAFVRKNANENFPATLLIDFQMKKYLTVFFFERISTFLVSRLESVQFGGTVIWLY